MKLYDFSFSNVRIVIADRKKLISPFPTERKENKEYRRKYRPRQAARLASYDFKIWTMPDYFKIWINIYDIPVSQAWFKCELDCHFGINFLEAE